MRLLVVLGCGLALATVSRATTAADLARQVTETALDPEECYQVRDLTLVRDEIRLYFTDGFLIFSKPVGGVRTSAVFAAGAEGDAEILVLLPTRGERQSLASFTGSPNLNEHFSAAGLVFTDNTYAQLLEQIRANPANKKVPEMGHILAPEWRGVARNLAASFESRLVLDLLSHRRESLGFFFAAIAGRTLGNFDVVWDARGMQQIGIGQLNYRDLRAYFDTWTAFEGRSFRRQKEHAPAGWRETDFALKHYRIEASLTPPDLRLQVVTKVTLVPAVDGEVAFPVDLSRQMTITKALVDGRPAEVLTRESLRSNLIRNTGNDLVLLLSAEPLRAGRDYEVELHHEGAVVFDAGNRVYSVGSRGNWYPGRGLQFANFDLTFRYPKDLVLVSSGDLVSDDTEGDWRVTRRRTTTPIRVAGFNLGAYERVKVNRAGISVEVYANRSVERALQPRPAVLPPPQVTFGRPTRRDPFSIPLPAELAPPPPSPLARLQELAFEVASALDFMSARFGPPPIKTLTVSPVPGMFGQGFPGLIYLSTLSYLSPRERPVARLSEGLQLFFSEILGPHEVAHQWWGNTVVSSGYQDDWLLESLANYSALMYLEKRKGARSLDQLLERYRNDLLMKNDSGKTIESAGPVALGTRLLSSQNPGAWRTIIYEKGSWILHMLRRRMGDERFNSLLGELRRRYEFKGLSTEDFRELAASFLPPKSPDPKLEAFFDQWVYSTGIPTLELKYSVKGKAPALRLTATLIQSEVNPEFSALVPIEIQTGRTRATHWIRSGPEPVSITVALRQAPTRVLLDPEEAVLAVRR